MVIFLITLAINGFAEEHDNNLNTRLYIQPEYVTLTQNGIFVDIEGNVMEVENIGFDNDGLFVDLREGFSVDVRCGICKRWYNPQKQSGLCPHKIIKK